LLDPFGNTIFVMGRVSTQVARDGALAIDSTPRAGSP
jgi:hypothetical protein